jgi:aminodeoxyfutalosine deaminase
MTLYRCRTLVPMDGPPIHNAAFVVEEGRFTAVGQATDLLRSFSGPAIELGSGIVIPGLINAHCHLEYSLMRGAILPSRNFSHWVSRINALKRGLSDEDYIRSIESGLGELQRNGVTSVFNVVAAPQVLPRLAKTRIRTWHFLELIDVRPHPWIDEYAFGAWMCFDRSTNRLQSFGLSPHAPYTASHEMFELARVCWDQFRMPVTVHVAESLEEYEMFAHRKGALFKFLSELGRPMDDCGFSSPFRYLAEKALLSERCILVHMNELDDEDFVWLQRPEWRGLSVVHCPKSHRFLHHRPFPLERLRQLGVMVSLGTDSLASNDSLNLFAEMRVARRNYPSLTPEQLLRMCTVYPALAIGQENCLGRISSGYLADAILVPAGDDERNVYEAIVENRQPIPWMMVDGIEVR